MTGNRVRQVNAGSAQLCAYDGGVEWTQTAIRRARTARGWSQRQLAEALSAAQNGRTVAVRVITDWETGKSRPSGRNIAALDRVLGDTPTPESTLRDATVMELLAELATRYAALEAATRRGDHPEGPPERYTWFKSDAPTARRAKEGDPNPGDQGESGSPGL